MGTRVGIISATVNGKANYRNSLVLKYNEQGMYLKPVLLFSLFHKPILIPWEEIIEVKNKTKLFHTAKEIIIGDPMVAAIEINNNVYDRIKSYLVKHAS